MKKACSVNLRSLVLNFILKTNSHAGCFCRHSLWLNGAHFDLSRKETQSSELSDLTSNMTLSPTTTGRSMMRRNAFMDAHHSQGSLTFSKVTQWERKNKKYPELVLGHTNYSVNSMQLFLLLCLLAAMKGRPPLGEMVISKFDTGNLLKVPCQSKR